MRFESRRWLEPPCKDIPFLYDVISVTRFKYCVFYRPEGGVVVMTAFAAGVMTSFQGEINATGSSVAVNQCSKARGYSA